MSAAIVLTIGTVLAALITYLGVTKSNVTEQRDDVQTQVSRLKDQLATLTSDNADLRKQLDAAAANSGSAPDTSTDGTGDHRVRRTTAKNLLTLSDGYSADLDSVRPDWDVGYAENAFRFDVQFTGRDIRGQGDSDLAIVSGVPTFASCRSATGYGTSIDVDQPRLNLSLCMRTSEDRLAGLVIKDESDEEIRDQLSMKVTVWDPPIR